MEAKQEIHLKLGVQHLTPAHRDKPPEQPRFFHFMESVTAKNFQDATLITFTRPDGKEYIIKDLYNRRLK